MAKRNNIKGITIEINGDVTKLDRALSQVDKDLGKTQKNLKEVERLLKLDPKNVELLDQKQRLLAQQVELTSKRYETLKKALDGVTVDDDKAAEWAKQEQTYQSEITKTTDRLRELQKQMESLNKDAASAGTAEAAESMTDLQRQAAEAEERLKELNSAASKTYDELGRPISLENYDALQRELAQSKIDMNQAQDAAVSLDGGVADLSDTSGNAGGIIGKLNDLLGGSGGGMVVAAAAGAAAIKLAADAIKALADWTAQAVKESAAFADEMLTLSQQTGFSTDFLQGLDYAAGLVDVSSESIISAMRKLKQNLASDSSSVREAFDAIGVIPEQLANSGMSMEETFRSVVSALSGVESELERDQIAMQLFGRGADELAGVIDDGGRSLYAYIEAAREAGYVMSGEELDALGAVDDQFYKLDKAMELAKKRIAVELAPEIINLTGRILDLIEGADWEKFGRTLSIVLHDVTPLVIDLAEAVIAASEAIASLIQWMDSFRNRAGNDGLLYRNDGTIRQSPGVRGYASGGVIEPNNPMLALVGDNRSEREVITPESLMRRVVREESGGGRGGVEVVAEFRGTDDQLVRLLAPKLRAYWATEGAVL